MNKPTKPEEKKYTEEEIKKMSYWELWGLRRNTGAFYHIATVSFYAFLVYLAVKVYYLFGSRQLEGLQFSLEWWSVPLCILIGTAYWYIHEYIYHKKFGK